MVAVFVFIIWSVFSLEQLPWGPFGHLTEILPRANTMLLYRALLEVLIANS